MTWYHWIAATVPAPGLYAMVCAPYSVPPDQYAARLPADKHPTVEQELVEEERKKMIRHAIEKLPEKQRAAVLLHKYQELDYAEIAKILSCSESALKSLLFRAYEALRVELAPLVARAKH